MPQRNKLPSMLHFSYSGRNIQSTDRGLCSADAGFPRGFWNKIQIFNKLWIAFVMKNCHGLLLTTITTESRHAQPALTHLLLHEKQKFCR